MTVTTDDPTYPHDMADLHNAYPHDPGYLHDCAACAAACHCTLDPGKMECVFEGTHRVGWVNIVFMQGEEAHEVMNTHLYQLEGVVLKGPYASGVTATVAYLSAWDMGTESEHTFSEHAPGFADDMRTVREGDYILSWDTHMGCISLDRKALRDE